MTAGQENTRKRRRKKKLKIRKCATLSKRQMAAPNRRGADQDDDDDYDRGEMLTTNPSHPLPTAAISLYYLDIYINK